jgi:hypothetical protein
MHPANGPSQFFNNPVGAVISFLIFVVNSGSYVEITCAPGISFPFVKNLQTGAVSGGCGLDTMCFRGVFSNLL